MTRNKYIYLRRKYSDEVFRHFVSLLFGLNSISDDSHPWLSSHTLLKADLFETKLFEIETLKTISDESC